MGYNRGILVAVLLAMAAAELVGNVAAVTYVVGDSLGWNIPPTAVTYATYASQHVFAVGDVLVFNFTTGIHDVARVARGAYDNCASTNPIALATVGPASFTLDSAGPDYYICTFGQHCSFGQRLAINVTASRTATPPTPAPTSPPSSTTPPMSPTPPPSSSSPGPSPSGTFSPESSPAPAPSGSSAMTPSPSNGVASSPGLGLGPSSDTGGNLSPPPPPGSVATRKRTIGGALMVIMSLVVGFMMI